MSHDEDWSALGEDLWEQLTSSQREVLVESIQKCLGTSAETLFESDRNDLQERKESNVNERAMESADGGIRRASVISYSPGVMELQQFNEDESLFCDPMQGILHPMGDRQPHNHQLAQSQDMMSVFDDSHIFCANLIPSQTIQPSPEVFELYHPVQTVTAEDWGSASSVHGVEEGLSVEVELIQGCPTILDSDGRSLTSIPDASVARQQPMSDYCRSSSHASKTTVPSQEISPAAVVQIQVLKTEKREEEWPAEEEASEERFDVKKKERRRQQNRTAARRCRNRKKETFEHMIQAAQTARMENVQLKKEVLHWREKLNCVMELVKLHQTHCGLQLTFSKPRNPVLPDSTS